MTHNEVILRLLAQPAVQAEVERIEHNAVQQAHEVFEVDGVADLICNNIHPAGRGYGYGFSYSAGYSTLCGFGFGACHGQGSNVADGWGSGDGDF